MLSTTTWVWVLAILRKTIPQTIALSREKGTIHSFFKFSVDLSWRLPPKRDSQGERKFPKKKTLFHLHRDNNIDVKRKVCDESSNSIYVFHEIDVLRTEHDLSLKN